MAQRTPIAPHYIFAIAEPLIGLEFLFYNFVAPCGPVGHSESESPSSRFRYVIFAWQNIGIASGNGCEITYHLLILFGTISLSVLDLSPPSMIWKHTGQ